MKLVQSLCLNIEYHRGQGSKWWRVIFANPATSWWKSQKPQLRNVVAKLDRFMIERRRATSTINAVQYHFEFWTINTSSTSTLWSSVRACARISNIFEAKVQRGNVQHLQIEPQDGRKSKTAAQKVLDDAWSKHKLEYCQDHGRRKASSTCK